MKKFFIALTLVLCVFAMILFVKSGREIKVNESTDLQISKNEENCTDMLQKLSRLYEDFQSEKHKSQDAETDFYNSDYYNKFVEYLSSKDSTSESIENIGSKIGNLDLKGINSTFDFNGKTYNIRMICYNADYYVKNLTDSAMRNKNIYIQIYNNDEFYFYTLCQRENNYLNDFRAVEFNGKINIIVLGSSGAYYPGSAFIGCFMWDGENIYKSEMLNLSENDDLISFGENDGNVCYTENNSNCRINMLNWYNSFYYNTELKNKFAFYGREDFAYVVRYNDTDNEFTDLTYVTAEFNEENDIVLSSESFEQVKSNIKLVLENGKYVYGI